MNELILIEFIYLLRTIRPRWRGFGDFRPRKRGRHSLMNNMVNILLLSKYVPKIEMYPKSAFYFCKNIRKIRQIEKVINDLTKLIVTFFFTSTQKNKKR